MHQKLISQTYGELSLVRERLEQAEKHGLRVAASLRDRIATIESQIRVYEHAAFRAP